MAEWSKVHDWKSCVERTSTEGSNPSLSAIFRFVGLRGAVAQLGERQVRNLEVVSSIPICSTIFSDSSQVVLDGEIAVPCTRNPL